MSQHRDYEVPPAEVLRDIAAKQDVKERETKAARKQHLFSDPQAAAELIQVSTRFALFGMPLIDCTKRNYRGYRARRELQGYTLSASERWAEVGDAYIIIQAQALT